MSETAESHCGRGNVQRPCFAAAARLARLTVLLLACGLGLPYLVVTAARADSTPCNCESCHGDFHGENWAGCSGCHDSPPATGSHLVHYNSAPEPFLPYGDAGVYSTATEYKFGCGNCHPLDVAKHRNGTVDVELYDAASPVGSLKAKNPPAAAYDSGTKTCGNVYCHSGYTVSSSAVGNPLRYPANPVPPGYKVNNTYIMDPTCSTLVYPPYTVNYQRVYETSPAWGTSGNITTCQECHGFPVTTYSPTVSAGVGDSHQWIDPYGYRNLHAWNMLGNPIACRTCHYDTVTQAAGYHYVGYDEIQYDPVPLASRATHVNGVPDVAFDTVNATVYGTHSYSLAAASYDPADKTCSDVACHYNPPASAPPGTSNRWQRKPAWGAPYRWYMYGVECDLCHRYGTISQTCTTVP